MAEFLRPDRHVCRATRASTYGISAVKLAADPDVRRGSASVVAAALLALARESRFAWTVTTESPGAGGAAGTAGPSGTVPQAWVARLSCVGAGRDAAVAELHGLLLRAARFEIGRRRAAFPHLGGADLDDLAWQSADDALMSILRRLGDFRGDSQFTTWACKFAIVEAGAKVRRHAWRGREIPLAPAFWPTIADDAPSPHQHAEAQDLLRALREEVGRLTARQREVFVAITLNDVPIDVLAERLNTTRGALYKTLHDTRHKLRAALAARGLGAEGERR
jgi:RNA polymerase sigma-70 factor, ECF subfamily